MTDDALTTEGSVADAVSIRDLRVACIIGILPEERTRNQAIMLDVDLWLDLTKAGAGADLSATVDYFALSRAFEHILRAGKFRLLESAAMALAAFGLAQTAAPRRGRVTIHKPEALKGNGLASVTIDRTVAQVVAWRRPGGIVFSCPDCALAVGSDGMPEVRAPWR